MEITLILLTSTIVSALLCGSFYLGMQYQKGNEPKKNDTFEVTEDNKEILIQLDNYLKYGGRK